MHLYSWAQIQTILNGTLLLKTFRIFSEHILNVWKSLPDSVDLNHFYVLNAQSSAVMLLTISDIVTSYSYLIIVIFIIWAVVRAL